MLPSGNIFPASTTLKMEALYSPETLVPTCYTIEYVNLEGSNMIQLCVEASKTKSAFVDATHPLQTDIRVHLLDLIFNCEDICSFLLILHFVSTFFTAF
jgi:hypothetical protein